MKWLALSAILLSGCVFDPAGELGPDVGDEDDKRDQTDPPREPSDDPSPPIPEPEPRPDPAPNPEPCELVDVQLLMDSDFDGGGDQWIEQSPFQVITDRAPLLAHTPDYTAWLGGYSFGTDRVLQPLMVPNQAIAMTLHAELARDEPLINFDDDARLKIEIRDMNMNTLEVIENRKSGDIDDDWQSFDWEIDGYYNGMAVILMFEVDTDFDAMSVLVDSVELRATVCE